MKETGEKKGIYDDSFEKLSNIKKKYQKFFLSTCKFDDEIKNAYSLFKGGVPLLSDEDEKSVFVDSEDTHTLILGATGSKKTRLVVMPTVKVLGYAGESMIISDPKAEIYGRTADQLEKLGYQIVVLNFRNPTIGNGWNPLHIPYQFYIRGDVDKACEMVNDIANNFIAADVKDKDPFWRDSAANLFFGLTLILFKLGKETNEGNMMVNISNVCKLRRQMFENKPEKTWIWNYFKEDEIIAPALSGTVLTASETRAGIISVFDQKIRHFVCQPSFLDMLSDHSIDFEQIVERKTVVYLIMPDEKTTFHMMISLFVKQSYEYLINKVHDSLNEKINIRLNYILDEFSSLPTIKDFPAMITAARSRNFRFYLVVQSKKQLIQRYGDEAETIQSNCTNWIFLTSRELSLLEEISALCGRVRDGKLPLVSIFTLQHLDKDRGEALILSGRLKPFFAYLPDIDSYDKKSYMVRTLEKAERCSRVEVDYEQLIKQILGIEVDEDVDSDYGDSDSYGLTETMEYAQEVNKAYEAYNIDDYECAYEHFVKALELRNNKMKECDCENNLGYMLRRREIKEIVINGIQYEVPEILSKGVKRKKGFFLMNMALYESMVGKTIDMHRGEIYVKQIDVEEAETLKDWWEKLALQEELEGYMVLYWLYRFDLIDFSIMGTMEEIVQILNTRFHVIPDQISECI